MKKTTFRITYIVPLSFIATLLVFSYRYVWFSVEVIPTDRIMIAFLTVFLSSFLFLNEAREELTKNK